MDDKISVIPATLAHVEAMADRLRPCDIRELMATSPCSPRRSLMGSLLYSEQAWTGLVGDRPVMMFGVATTSHVTMEGSPWMLGTPELEIHAVQFLRGCADYVGQMRAPYKFLENHIDARNAVSIRWLKWLGFEIHPARPYGYRNLPFHRFTMKGGCYV